MTFRLVLPMLLAANCGGKALGTWKMIPSKSRQGGGPYCRGHHRQIRSPPQDNSTRDLDVLRRAREWHLRDYQPDSPLRWERIPSADLGLEERPDTLASIKLDAWTAEVFDWPMLAQRLVVF